MEQYMIDANEQFFRNILHYLKDDGVWGWPGAMEMFRKQDGKLAGSHQALRKVKMIVSEKFYKEFFVELKKDS
jgi:hypothetical protein